jgi:hypothetical protein
MKRILIASLFSLAAAPVLATTPSFNDFPEQGRVAAARAVIAEVAPSFNDHGVIEGNAGLAGRAAAEIAQSGNALWTPAY